MLNAIFLLTPVMQVSAVNAILLCAVVQVCAKTILLPPSSTSKIVHTTRVKINNCLYSLHPVVL